MVLLVCIDIQVDSRAFHRMRHFLGSNPHLLCWSGLEAPRCVCVFVESDSKASPLFLDLILHGSVGGFWTRHSKEAALRWVPRNTTSAVSRFEDGLCALRLALFLFMAFLWQASLAFSWIWPGFSLAFPVLLVLLWPSIKTWNLSLRPKLPFQQNKLGLLAFCFSIRNEASCPARSFAGFMMDPCSGANQAPRPGCDTLVFLTVSSFHTALV